jgi:N-methylhydantoinase B
LRLISAGALNIDVEKLILANVRTPDERKGDLGAQLENAARNRASSNAWAPARRRRAHGLHGRGHGLFGTAHARALSDLPDGEGAFEDYCDGDGIADDESGNDARFASACISSRATA